MFLKGLFNLLAGSSAFVFLIACDSLEELREGGAPPLRVYYRLSGEMAAKSQGALPWFLGYKNLKQNLKQNPPLAGLHRRQQLQVSSTLSFLVNPHQ